MIGLVIGCTVGIAAANYIFGAAAVIAGGWFVNLTYLAPTIAGGAVEVWLRNRRTTT